MSEDLEIVIWDLDASRIHAIDRNLHNACQRLGMKIRITCMCEPPLVSRMGLAGRVPLLEIRNQYWSLPEGREISENACVSLLRRFSQPGSPCAELPPSVR